MSSRLLQSGGMRQSGDPLLAPAKRFQSERESWDQQPARESWLQGSWLRQDFAFCAEASELTFRGRAQDADFVLLKQHERRREFITK